jgi:hypothetical protein
MKWFDTANALIEFKSSVTAELEVTRSTAVAAVNFRWRPPSYIGNWLPRVVNSNRPASIAFIDAQNLRPNQDHRTEEFAQRAVA